MTSTYTTNKNLQEPAYNDSNWNIPLNSNFTTIDQALGNVTTLTVTGLSGTQALSSAQYIPFALNITGTLTANVTYQVPSGIGGQWTVYNGTVGGYTVALSSGGGGASFVIPSGTRTLVMSDGTNIYQVGGSSGGGTLTGSTATFVGSISGTTLTVASVVTGTLAVNQMIANAAPGTYITGFGTGTGGAGTYTVSVSQTLASGTITSVGTGVNFFNTNVGYGTVGGSGRGRVIWSEPSYNPPSISGGQSNSYYQIYSNSVGLSNRTGTISDQWYSDVRMLNITAEANTGMQSSHLLGTFNTLIIPTGYGDGQNGGTWVSGVPGNSIYTELGGVVGHRLAQGLGGDRLGFFSGQFGAHGAEQLANTGHQGHGGCVQQCLWDGRAECGSNQRQPEQGVGVVPGDGRTDDDGG